MIWDLLSTSLAVAMLGDLLRARRISTYVLRVIIIIIIIIIIVIEWSFRMSRSRDLKCSDEQSRVRLPTYVVAQMKKSSLQAKFGMNGEHYSSSGRDLAARNGTA